MPSATATFFLNVSAIQALCIGPKGSGIDNGVGAPLSTFGLSGDFYFDQTTSFPPNQYNLYGPKTTVWPSTAFSIPSVTFVGGVSSTLFSQITSVSANSVPINNPVLQTLTISNSGNLIPLIVSQTNTVFQKYLATFTHNAVTTFIITNSGTVGVNIAQPDADAAFQVVGSTRISSNLSAAGSLFIGGTASFGNLLSATGTSYLGNFIVYQGLANTGIFQVVGTNFTTNSASIALLSAYTAVFLPLSTNQPGPFRIQSTTFEVGSGTPSDKFFVIDPTFGTRKTTIAGSVSSLSAFSTFRFDANGNRILGNRQAGPGLLVLSGNTTDSVVRAFNSLYATLTTHGLIT